MSIANRWWGGVLLAYLLMLLAVRNLPWHLDDYDQAKQAYVSFEMLERGNWLFQHTPMQKSATKPPLAGWISAGLRMLTGSWEVAWRLPSFAAAVLLLALLWREGGWLAGAVFALNAFTPRLATLARTDMLLALWLTLVGWMIYSKIKTGLPWSPQERWTLCACVLASMLTKGPILFAFVLPGLVLYSSLKKDARPWCAWWVWVLPLLVFALWAGYGIWSNRAFYNQVVLKEFAGRFDASETAVHDPKPVYAYLAKLIPMFGPWSWLLLAIPFLPKVRQAVAGRRELLWLACWVAGAFVVMSLIPSKRADRIFPIVPASALLLAQVLPLFPSWRKLTLAAVGISVISTGVYTAWNLVDGHRSNGRALVQFGSEARQMSQGASLRVVSGKDEGMLLYAGIAEFTPLKAALQLWEEGECDALILPEQEWQKGGFAGGEAVLRSAPAKGKNSRYLLVRPASTLPTGNSKMQP